METDTRPHADDGPGAGAAGAAPANATAVTMGGADATIFEFATYEEYLDSQITPIDMFYLESRELARQLVELGYRGTGEPLKREDFETRKKAAKALSMNKRMMARTIASQGRDLADFPFLQALADREEANLNGRLNSIIFIRTHNQKGQEISGYVDYAQRLKTDNMKLYFERAKPFLPRPSDLSFYNWETQTCATSASSNYQVISENGGGILFKNKRDRKIVNVDPGLPSPGDSTTRSVIRTAEHTQVIIYDHSTRRKV